MIDCTGNSSRNERRRSRMSGVTLLELMIVVVVVGILAAIAVPSYRAYTLRAQRSDATAALLRLASAQEKFYLQNNTYATNAQMAGAPPAGLGMAGTERGWYTLSIDTGADAIAYTARAVAPAASPQFSDTPCRTFTIDQSGARTARNAADALNNEACWR